MPLDDLSLELTPEQIFSFLQPSPAPPIVPDPQIMAGIEQMGTPYQEPVPQAPNPWMTAGATFASTLADQLGARGAQYQMANRIAQAEAEPDRARVRNQERADQALRQRQLASLEYLRNIQELQIKQAEKMQDLTTMAKIASQRASTDRTIAGIQAQSREAVAKEVTGRALAVQDKKNKGSERVALLRNSLTTRYGASPIGQLLIKEATGFEQRAMAPYNAMVKQNTADEAAFDPPTYTQEQLDAAFAHADSMVYDYYRSIEDKLAHVKPDTTSTTKTTQKSLKDILGK